MINTKMEIYGEQMTREEKINIFVEQILKEEGVSDTWIDGFKGGLGVMYDALSIDFESRTCESCKHSEYHIQQDILECYKLFKELNQRCYKCENDITIFEVVKDFGCNKWESI